ncbi:uncharacterized protein LOC107261903 [Ricinus communis]|uniref:uncharacterized protein LOC107261903 n=1 Tax=Ricinus communis TaxID=3988 RepID=UPI0007724B77|nr:uncharacterized protein LOC107261903 [Ricinus communis]|eukprot:XP_015579770.1 uncharacterized protein LOC107261903 [Ricinus communis]
MEEIRPSSSPSPPPHTAVDTTINTTTPTSTAHRKQEKSEISSVKKECLAFAVSLQESFQYIKAKFVGQAKKITARDEKEATAADLQVAKMEVEAADQAEYIKKKLDKSL